MTKKAKTLLVSILCSVVIIAGGVLGYFFIFKNSKQSNPDREYTQIEQDFAEKFESENIEQGEEEIVAGDIKNEDIGVYSVNSISERFGNFVIANITKTNGETPENVLVKISKQGEETKAFLIDTTFDGSFSYVSIDRVLGDFAIVVQEIKNPGTEEEAKIYAVVNFDGENHKAQVLKKDISKKPAFITQTHAIFSEFSLGAYRIDLVSFPNGEVVSALENDIESFSLVKNHLILSCTTAEKIYKLDQNSISLQHNFEHEFEAGSEDNYDVLVGAEYKNLKLQYKLMHFVGDYFLVEKQTTVADETNKSVVIPYKGGLVYCTKSYQTFNIQTGEFKDFESTSKGEYFVVNNSGIDGVGVVVKQIPVGGQYSITKGATLAYYDENLNKILEYDANYGKLSTFKEKRFVAYNMVENKTYVLDIDGKVVLGSNEEQVLLGKNFDSNYMISLNQSTGKLGVLNKDGEVVLDAEYDAIFPINASGQTIARYENTYMDGEEEKTTTEYRRIVIGGNSKKIDNFCEEFNAWFERGLQIYITFTDGAYTIYNLDGEVVAQNVSSVNFTQSGSEICLTYTQIKDGVSGLKSQKFKCLLKHDLFGRSYANCGYHTDATASQTSMVAHAASGNSFSVSTGTYSAKSGTQIVSSNWTYGKLTGTVYSSSVGTNAAGATVYGISSASCSASISGWYGVSITSGSSLTPKYTTGQFTASGVVTEGQQPSTVSYNSAVSFSGTLSCSYTEITLVVNAHNTGGVDKIVKTWNGPSSSNSKSYNIGVSQGGHYGDLICTSLSGATSDGEVRVSFSNVTNREYSATAYYVKDSFQYKRCIYDLDNNFVSEDSSWSTGMYDNNNGVISIPDSILKAQSNTTGVNDSMFRSNIEYSYVSTIEGVRPTGEVYSVASASSLVQFKFKYQRSNNTNMIAVTCGFKGTNGNTILNDDMGDDVSNCLSIGAQSLGFGQTTQIGSKYGRAVSLTLKASDKFAIQGIKITAVNPGIESTFVEIGGLEYVSGSVLKITKTQTSAITDKGIWEQEDTVRSQLVNVTLPFSVLHTDVHIDVFIRYRTYTVEVDVLPDSQMWNNRLLNEDSKDTMLEAGYKKSITQVEFNQNIFAGSIGSNYKNGISAVAGVEILETVGGNVSAEDCEMANSYSANLPNYDCLGWYYFDGGVNSGRRTRIESQRVSNDINTERLRVTGNIILRPILQNKMIVIDLIDQPLPSTDPKLQVFANMACKNVICFGEKVKLYCESNVVFGKFEKKYQRAEYGFAGDGFSKMFVLQNIEDEKRFFLNGVIGPELKNDEIGFTFNAQSAVVGINADTCWGYNRVISVPEENGGISPVSYGPTKTYPTFLYLDKDSYKEPFYGNRFKVLEGTSAGPRKLDSSSLTPVEFKEEIQSFDDLKYIHVQMFTAREPSNGERKIGFYYWSGKSSEGTYLPYGRNSEIFNQNIANPQVPTESSFGLLDESLFFDGWVILEPDVVKVLEDNLKEANKGLADNDPNRLQMYEAVADFADQNPRLVYKYRQTQFVLPEMYVYAIYRKNEFKVNASGIVTNLSKPRINGALIELGVNGGVDSGISVYVGDTQQGYSQIMVSVTKHYIASEQAFIEYLAHIKLGKSKQQAAELVGGISNTYTAGAVSVAVLKYAGQVVDITKYGDIPQDWQTAANSLAESWI